MKRVTVPQRKFVSGKKQTTRSDFDLDIVMAARYAYYVKTTPFMDDHEYDKLEKEYEMLHDQLPVGSSCLGDYTDAQRALALYFIFSGRSLTFKHRLL